MVEQFSDFHDDAVFGLSGIGGCGRVQRGGCLRLRGGEGGARDVVFRVWRRGLARRVSLGGFSADTWHQQVDGAHLFAVDPAIEYPCIANADLA